MSEEEIGQVTADQIMISQMTAQIDSLQHQIGLLESKISILEERLGSISLGGPESLAPLSAQLLTQRNKVEMMVNRVLKLLDRIRF